MVISRENFYELSPILSKEMDWDREIIPVINICMQVEIKPQLGDVRYVDLTEWLDKKNEEEPCFFKLWEGGKYEGNCGEIGIFDGLKKALVYYVFAHLIKRQNQYMGQMGYRQFTDNYSQAAENKKIESDYQYYKQIADSIMVDCFKFLKICEPKCNTNSGKRKQFLTVISS
jgi:hypothetical protein